MCDVIATKQTLALLVVMDAVYREINGEPEEEEPIASEELKRFQEAAKEAAASRQAEKEKTVGAEMKEDEEEAKGEGEGRAEKGGKDVDKKEGNEGHEDEKEEEANGGDKADQ